MYYFFRKLVEIYIRGKYQLIIHHKENYQQIPKKGGYIIACNHQSYADPPIVAGLIRAKFCFMAKSELFKNPFISFLIKRLGAFPVVRGKGDLGAIDRAVSDIKSGKALLIFPEGTRSLDGVPGRGKSGVAVIAQAAKLPVLPVCIVYGEKKHKQRVDFSVGKLIMPDELHFNGERQQVRKAAEFIMNEIKSLREEIFSDFNNFDR